MKILIVDDSAVMRAMLKRELERAGYSVIEADSGDKAIAALLAQSSISLVTMDVEMPGKDGFATCSEIMDLELRPDWGSEKRKAPPVLFVTGSDSMELRRRGFESGAVDFIGKKFLESELVITVDRILKPEARFKGLRALVVEDSHAYRYIIVQCLKRMGILVSEADSGVGACKFLQAAPHAYDLVLTDFEMPHMNGLEFVRKVRQEFGFGDIPVVMLSAVADKGTQIEMFRAGVDDYLEKPFIREEFVARVTAHLDSSILRKRLKSSVNELKRVNSELQRSKDSLLKANTDARELLHVLCHDLANPFGAIISMLEIIEEPSQFMALKKDLGDVARNGMEVIDLVRKMRALDEGKSKIALGRFELSMLIDECAMMLRSKYVSKGVSLELDVPKGLFVSVEPVSFVNSVMNNLITNAVKFSKVRSTVKVKAFVDGSKTVVTVRDAGVGMPKSILDVIFEIGRPTSREGTAGESGTGFGMPLVKKFVDAYNGSISICSKEATKESPDDHWTEVRLELPSA